jgi:archaellum component FlaC
MPIIETVEQLADFLEQNEEWRRRIFSILVPRELARLPAEFEEFRAEVRREFDAIRQEIRSDFARVDEQFARVDERFARVDEQFARVDERFVQVNERIAQAEREIESLRAEMRERFAQVDREFEAVRREMREGFEQLRAEMREGYAELAQRIQRNTDDIAELKGKSLEREYRDKARSIFGRYFRSVAVIDWIDLEDPLEAVAPLSDAERTELSVIDLLVRGRRRTDGQDTVLVIEVSWTITHYDVERAVRRAEIFRQRGFTATPTVAGSEISQEVQLAAQQAGCAVVLNGRYEFDLPFRG